MSRVERPPNIGKTPRNKPTFKRKLRSKSFSIKFLNLLRKMYVEPTASSKAFSKQVQSSSSTETEGGFKKKSHALRFSEYSLKMLFAKDLLKLLGKFSSNKRDETTSYKDTNLSLVSDGEKAASSGKNLAKNKVKTLNPNSLSQKHNRNDIQSFMKKELTSLQKQLREISTQLKPEEQSLKKIFNLLNQEISSMSSNIKQMPKIRMQILYSELMNIKSKINSELAKTEPASEKKEDISLLKAQENAAKASRHSSSNLPKFSTQRAFSSLITLYHSLLELKAALTDGKQLGIFAQETGLTSLQPRALIPLGIVYPFSSFKSSISLSKSKKKKFNDFEAEDEYEEEDPSNKKQKK